MTIKSKEVGQKSIRKLVLTVLIGCLVFLIAIGVAAEDETVKKGFLLPGVSALFDGSETIRGGVQELIGGNEKLADGLSTLGGALDKDIAGNLNTMKSGIDSRMVPGLDSILHGITGQVVPGMSKMKDGIDDRIVPGLKDIREGLRDEMSPGMKEMINGLTGQIIPGLKDMQNGIDQEMIVGLDKILGGITEKDGMIDGLTQIRYGLSGVGDPNKPGVSEGIISILNGLGDDSPGETIVYGLTRIHLGLRDSLSPGLGNAINTIGTVPGSPEPPGEKTTILNDLELAKVSSSEPTVQAAIAVAQTKLEEVSSGLDTAQDKIDDEMVSGLEKILGVINNQIIKGLVDMQTGVNLMVPGLDIVLAGLGDANTEDTIVYGLNAIRSGLAGPFSTGLTDIVDGLDDEIVPGLKKMKKGIDDEIVPGLNQIIPGLSNDVSGGLSQLMTGFTKTEGSGGYAAVVDTVNRIPKPVSTGSNVGIAEGLVQIRTGLSSLEPVRSPGVSDGLGQVVTGIKSEVLGGINELSAGVTGLILPGLNDMHEGIQGELQPGFSKVSLLLLIIWLATLVVFLIIGLLIGRATKKASAGRSAAS